MPRIDERDETREHVLLGIACFVCGVWMFVVLVHSLYPKHDIPPEVHGVMLILVPLLYGSSAWQSRREEKAEDAPQPTPEAQTVGAE